MTRLARLDAAGKQMQATPPTDLTAALTALKQEVDGLAADAVALQKAVAADGAAISEADVAAAVPTKTTKANEAAVATAVPQA